MRLQVLSHGLLGVHPCLATACRSPPGVGNTSVTPGGSKRVFTGGGLERSDCRVHPETRPSASTWPAEPDAQDNHMDPWRLFIAVLLVSAMTAAESHRLQVLCLHSYHPADWSDAIMRGYREVLGIRTDLDLTVEYMDTKRREDAAYLDLLAGVYRAKYATVRFDLILTSDDNAYNFALQRRKELFADAPLVFCGVNRWRDVATARPSRVVGVAEQVDWGETLAVARRARPQARTIHVITDGTETAAKNLAELRQAAGDMPLDVPAGLDLKQLRTHLATISRDDFAIFIAYWREPVGRAVSPDEMAAALQASTAPVFGRSEWAIGRGQAGGLCVSGLRQGRAAANLGLAVLTGTRIDDLPLITDSPNIALFDWLELGHHGIDPGILPAGAEIINRPDPLLRIPRPIAAMALACFILLVALVAVLVVLMRVRRRAQASTVAAAANLRTILHSMGDGVIATDADGRITALNPVAERLTGWTLAEAAGRPIEDVFRLVSGTDRTPMEVPVRPAMRTGTAQHLSNHALLLVRDGTERHIADSGAPMRDPAGGTVGSVLVFRDVSERYALEERLRRAQTMEALGRMAGGIAHDFNNQLTAILGGIQLLQLRCSKQPDTVKLAATIESAAERAAELTTKLLTLARSRPVKTGSCDIHRCMEAAAVLLRHTLNRNIALEMDFSAWRAWIPGDQGAIENALINLCLNARDAMPDGGRLRLASSELDQPPPGCPPRPDGWLRLTVTDTGMGMDASTRERVFEPFFTTKPTGKGTGLGLSMVYATITELGGQLHIDSAPGRGTKVILDLPRCPAPAETVANPPSTAVHPDAACVLVVDDEPTALDIARSTLEADGHTVLTAVDGADAIAVFAREQERIRVVVLDMIMPRQDGRACLAGIRALRPGTPAILVSGFMGDPDAAKGFDEVLAKPYRLEALREAVRRRITQGRTGA